jgi:hypothetical protein
VTLPQPLRSNTLSVTSSKYTYHPEDAPVVVTPVAPFSIAHKIPPAPVITGEWVAPDQIVDIAGRLISGGLFYRGTVLKAPSGANDPCLIDPHKPVSESGNLHERQTMFWPSYVDLSPAARNVYLDWLASGRDSPTADMGFVFLYFYGLERRVIFDGTQTPEAQKDWPSIELELRRLLTVYAKKSANFREAATELLQLVQLAQHPEELYNRQPPEFVKSWEVPMALKLALGQTAKDAAPLPADWALAWIKADPDTNLRTAANRCPGPFARLFKMHYESLHGKGFTLPKPNTKLRLAYRPYCPVFRTLGEIQFTFDDTPNITVLRAPLAKLKLIADMAADELDAYSRYVGRHPAAAETIEGLLHLPVAVWSEELQAAMLGFKAQVMHSSLVVTSVGKVLEALGKTSEPSKDQVIALSKAFLSMGIGVEPNVLYGAKTPGLTEPIALFLSAESDESFSASNAFDQAMLGVAASSMFIQEASLSAAQEFLREQVFQWTHLTPAHRQRLLAQVELLKPNPDALKPLRKPLKDLEANFKKPFLALLTGVALLQGTATPVALQGLEKLYKMMGLDPKQLFSDVHSHTSSPGTHRGAPSGGAPEAPPILDLERVAQLQKESAEVSILLAGIFTEDSPVAAQTVHNPVAAPLHTFGLKLSGLDSAHLEFANSLLLQPKWHKESLLALADSLGLMLEGAIEQINDASFDAYNMSFTEGDDPLEVNPEILEILKS